MLVAVDERNLVAVVAAMERRGLVERAVDPSDARRRIVRLAQKGRSLAARMRQASREMQDEFLAALAEKERAHLNLLLQRLFDYHSRTSIRSPSGRRR